MEQQRTKWFTDTIFLALIPALAYFLLYVYESGFLGFYGVPSQYISFELSEVISFAVLLFGLGFPILTFINFFYQFSSVFKSRASRRQVIFVFTIILYVSLFSIIFYEMGKNSLGTILLIGAGLVIFVFFISPIFFKKYKGTYIEKIEQNLEHVRSGKSEPESLWDVLINKAGLHVYDFFMVFVMLTFLASPFGLLNAYQKESYGVIKNSPECAVIYTKTDLLICTTFDRENKQFESGYQIYLNDDLKGVKIINEKIGPLTLKPTPTALPTPTPTKTPLPTITPVPTATP